MRQVMDERRRAGLRLLIGIVAVMWGLELINTLDSNHLDADGIYPRNLGRLWGILAAPFLHLSFAHLIDNTIPLVFMGLLIALQGAARLAAVSGIVVVAGGLLTWLVAPAHSVTVGASGLVFGYATYLLARGFFDRKLVEVLTGVIVGAMWGAALLASLVPQHGISWQGHAAGALAGVLAARALPGRDVRARSGAGRQGPLPRALAK